SMKITLATLVYFAATNLFSQIPTVSIGRIERLENFPSQYVDARNIDVWLPKGYSPTQKYSVLYMQDGQMLFDSTINWNHQEWKVDETLGQLMREERIKNCIVVAIWNGGQSRHADYFPKKPFESLTGAQKEAIYAAARSNGYAVFGGYKIQSDRYLKFIVTELKPLIDKKYATLSDRKNTIIAGSSMGGLISIYAICEYPKVFGGAACLSTHWPGIFDVERNPIPDAFLKYLKANLPNPKSHKIYFDYGDQTLDAMYPPLQKKVDEVMRKRGYSAKNWTTRFYPGADHSERAWSQRFNIPLLFLLGK
ncbi:MAG: alpha/beta hydrolase, partial [Saprospiraceae bacterium]